MITCNFFFFFTFLPGKLNNDKKLTERIITKYKNIYCTALIIISRHYHHKSVELAAIKKKEKKKLINCFLFEKNWSENFSFVRYRLKSSKIVDVPSNFHAAPLNLLPHCSPTHFSVPGQTSWSIPGWKHLPNLSRNTTPDGFNAPRMLLFSEQTRYDYAFLIARAGEKPDYERMVPCFFQLSLVYLAKKRRTVFNLTNND